MKKNLKYKIGDVVCITYNSLRLIKPSLSSWSSSIINRHNKIGIIADIIKKETLDVGLKIKAIDYVYVVLSGLERFEIDEGDLGDIF